MDHLESIIDEGFQRSDETLSTLRDFASEVNRLDITVAIIGFGKMGILHSAILNLLKPGIVEAVADKSRLMVFGASRLIKKMKFFRDLDKLFDEVNPDAVYITTPTKSHYPLILNMFRKRVKYVFVEKPPTMNSIQLKEVLSEQTSRESMVGFQKRYALTFRHAEKLLEEEAIGRITGVNAYIKSGDIIAPTNRFDSTGKGVLLDLGVHLIDLLERLIGLDKVEKASSKSRYTKVDDYFKAELISSNGSNVYIEITWSDPSFRTPGTYIEVHGEKGVMKISADYVKIIKNGSVSAWYKPHHYRGFPPVNLSDPEYVIENLYFLYCIANNIEPETSLRNSLKTMEIISRLYAKAAKTN